MNRALLLAAALLPAVAHAQSAPPQQPPPRPMPTYDDGWQAQPGGYQDSVTTDGMAHRQVRRPTDRDPRQPDPSGYDEPPPTPSDGWRAPRPYAREDQVDDGHANDAAHRADRNRTASLNRRTWPGYNAGPTRAPTGSYTATHAQYQAELDRYARDMQRYRNEQGRYADDMARWQAQTSACEHGDDRACDGPR